MPFVRIDGVTGLVYEPDTTNAPKKHPCADCFSCQWCADTRCVLCRRKAACSPYAHHGEPDQPDVQEGAPGPKDEAGPSS